jgi:DNA processing protein
MTRQSETAAMVALLRQGKRPPQLYADLVEDAGSAVAVLDDESNLDGEQASLFPADTDALLEAAQDEIDRWTVTGIELLTILDAAYPEHLRAVHDRPPLIFVKGRLAREDARAVAIVGARDASPRGVDAAIEFATEIVRHDYVITSGLAAGIDTAAHTAALNQGRRTIAVIGTGVNRAYPPENRELQRRIGTECAVVSQFWPDAPPNRRSFPMRNAVMSGISLATVIVEARETSGARVQARRALAHGRPVFLLGSLTTAEPWAREFAQRPGVSVVQTAGDLLERLGRLTSTKTLMR